MSLSTNVQNLATAVATNSKAMKILLNGNAADLSGLTTANKTSLLAAINEIAAAVGGAGAAIVDTGMATTSVWSSSKTNTSIAAAVAALVATAPAALDTLNELAIALGNDPNFATTITTNLGLKAPAASPTFTGIVSGVTKAHVGLGSVDNTTDLQKPISTAETAALLLKASAANPTFTGTVSGVTKSHVGLANADNTADSAKPISIAQASVNTAQATSNGGFALGVDMGNVATDFVAAFNAGLV